MNGVRFGFLAALSVLVAAHAAAEMAGRATGLSLLKNSGARSSALGEAFVAAADDITAVDFNPASLASLSNGQVSLQHERGVFDDTFSKAMLGYWGPAGTTFGVTIGRYSSGETTLFDGVSERSLEAQSDLLAGLALAGKRGKTSLGAGVRYLRTELAETHSDAAMSAEVGIQYQVNGRLRVGASGPMYQSKIKYGRRSEDLPSFARVGVAWDVNLALGTGPLPLRLALDVPYDVDRSEAAVAAGVEAQIGIVALRLGTNSGSDAQKFALGAGLKFSRSSFDYSLGLATDGRLDSAHKLNLSYRFDDAAKRIERASRKEGRTVYRVYRVRAGETLQSLALRFYGSASQWPELMALNRGMFSSPDEIKPGARIFIPGKGEGKK